MYDYVIVGAGAAGCVLAARLSEDRDVTVCLIEAGLGDEGCNIHVPLYFPRLFGGSCDWNHQSEAEEFCDGRRINLPRGRVVGGSTSMNAMIYSRGHRAYYDAWKRPDWTFDKLLPYFKRAENNERGPSHYHGADGPVTVCDPRSGNVISEAFVTAAVAAGYPSNNDFNGPVQDGFGFYQLTQKKGRRCSAATAYLHPAKDRRNLTVETGFQAHRVLFEGNRATGIQGLRRDEVVEIRAAREVIVSAGAYNSPHLLMLSGIGPAEHLREHGIPVVVDQPEVGQNLSDHPHALLVFTHPEPVSLLNAADPRATEQFFQEGTGPLTSNISEAGGFVRSRSGVAAPDLQFHVAPTMFTKDGLTTSHHAVSFGADILDVQSRGRVSLFSADPMMKPRIQHHYFSEPEDMELAVTSLRLSLHIGRQKALAPYVRTPVEAPASESEKDLRSYVRRHASTAFHPAGTCAIGAVVDEELRVRGTERLRVVDTSVMPTIFCNPTAPTIAIAERAADLIRDMAPLG
ncbi:choline dehydrogenase [Streptomyces albofaciens JCM 4342]|uniref:GMC family oxidoreductase n=1 Tax=Streptomyces albofaciens TaxID=66866 RepID=UPI00123A9C1A|nr:GMC family oxidoreductase N-terminal domain-containing protein [Streptomyces albofaciens]KAA6212721.1 choline dehydrogenase [Streptomyces albofaciens JCM 4342]